MIIHKDTIIRNKFHSGFERTLPVKWLVCHGTAGGGTLNWVRNMSPTNDFRSKRYRSYKAGIALFHYIIQRDGTVWEIIDPNRWVYHASIGKLDKGTIGVELVNLSPGNRKPYTTEQYASLVELYEHLAAPRFWQKPRFPDMNVIIGHGRCKQKVSGTWKNCPGKGFSWDNLDDLLRQNGWGLSRDPAFESMWGLTK